MQELEELDVQPVAHPRVRFRRKHSLLMPSSNCTQ